MKKQLLLAFCILSAWSANSQNWSRSGNALTGGEVLGSTNAFPVTFISNNVTRLTIDASGLAIFANDININGHYFGRGGGSQPSNLALGGGALGSNTSGNWNTAVGSSALFSNKTGINNTAIGLGTLFSNDSGRGNVAIGESAINNNISGDSNTAVGYRSLLTNSTGNYNTGIGFEVGRNNTSGHSNVYLGFMAGWSETGSNRLHIANNAASTLIYGEFDTARVGINTMSPKATLDVNGTAKISGLTAGAASDSVVTIDASGNLKKRNAASFGSTGGDATADTWATVAGVTSSATDVSVNGLTVGLGAGNISTNTALGTTALNSNTTGTENTATGSQSLRFNTTGSYNTAIGFKSLFSNTSGSFNVANGGESLFKNTTGAGNTATGFQSLYYNTGFLNTANGQQALKANTSGSRNTANGSNSLYSNTTGSENTANGTYALYDNTEGYSNTANGYVALRLNTSGANNTSDGYESLFSNTSGKNNTALGKDAGYSNTTGDSSVFLGNDAGRNATTSKRLYIANKATSTLIYGEFDTARVGINTTSPKATLDVNGTAKISGLTAGTASDSVVTIDASGNLYKRNAASFGSTGGDATADTWVTSGGVTSAATDIKANGYTFGRGRTNIADNLAIGELPLNNVTTGYYNTGVGRYALFKTTSGRNNTALGVESGYNNTTGSNNVSIGYSSMVTNTTGADNVSIGNNSLRSNNSYNNTAVGTQAAYKNSTGNGNLALGVSALYDNTTGNNNTVVGTTTGYGIVSGSNNTIVGSNINSLPASLTGHLIIGSTGSGGNRHIVGFGDGNIFLGAYGSTLPANTGERLQISAASNPLKLTGLTSGTTSDSVLLVTTAGVVKMINASSLNSGDTSKDAWSTVAGLTSISTDVKVNGFTFGRGATNVADNLAVGELPLNSVTTGYYNTGVGRYALYKTTTGRNNTALGVEAGYNNTTGSNNVSIGYASLVNNTTGADNVSIGNNSLRSNNSYNNTAVGTQAAYKTSTGNGNLALGVSALYDNTTGNNNTVVGTSTGYGIVTGSNNTIIGSNINSLPAALTGHLIVGSTGSAGIRHIVGFGDGNIYLGASGSALPTNTGEKLKVDNGTTQGTYTTSGWAHSSDARLKDNVQPLENSMDLISKLNGVSYNWKNNKEVGRQLGFIAQDVQKVIPEVVVGKEGDLEKGETLGMVYQNLVPVLVEAMKSMNAKQEKLEKENAELKERLNKLEGGKPIVVTEESTQTAVLDQDMLFNATPNPTNDMTTINYYLTRPYPNAYINVSNTEGKVIQTIKLISKKGNGSIQISFGNLSAGIYLYTLVAGETQVDTKKIELAK